jgi:hypothetical protein
MVVLPRHAEVAGVGGGARRAGGGVADQLVGDQVHTLELEGQQPQLVRLAPALVVQGGEPTVTVLDPDVVLRVDVGPEPADVEEIHGARHVGERALTYSRIARHTRPALINGVPGLVTATGGQPRSVIAFTTRAGRIIEIDILADPSRLRQLRV